jgi:uncharacterized membrane protein YqjE
VELNAMQTVQLFQRRVAFGALGLTFSAALIAWCFDDYRTFAIIAGQALFSCLLVYGAVKRRRL